MRIKELELIQNKSKNNKNNATNMDNVTMNYPKREMKTSGVTSFDKWLSESALKKHPFYGLQSNLITINSLENKREPKINKKEISDFCASEHAFLDILESKIKSTINILHDRRKVKKLKFRIK